METGTASVPPATGDTSGGSWRSCVGCLLGGLVVLGVLAGVGLHFYRRSAAQDERIDAEVIQPWARAAQHDTMAQAYRTLTTEAYRSRNSQEDVVHTYHTAIERWGPPREVSVIVSNGTYDATTERSFQRTRTSWVFERGTTLVLTFELVEDESGTLRVDAVSPGGAGHLLPRDLPSGPF